MDTIQFYAYPTDKVEGLDLLVDVDHHRPLLISPQDQEQLDRDWAERGYTRSAPIGTLSNVFFNTVTGETRLVYRLTEYKVYSGIAFPALPDTEEKLSPPLRASMRASAVGCAIETADGKIIAQRRKEGIIDGGRLDSGAARMMVYDSAEGKLDWQQQALEKITRELNIMDHSQISSLVPRAAFSSRGPVHVPATKGYFSGGDSGMVGSLVQTALSYGQISDFFERTEVGEVIGINKSDLARFIIEQSRKDNKGLCGDGCATLLSTLPPDEFYQTVEKINSRESFRIQFGSLRNDAFIERQ